MRADTVARDHIRMEGTIQASLSDRTKVTYILAVHLPSEGSLQISQPRIWRTASVRAVLCHVHHSVSA